MLPVEDIARSLAYYHRVFGFEADYALEHVALLRKGSASLFLVLESPPTSDKPDMTIARLVSKCVSPVNLTFRVDDVEALVATLQSLEPAIVFLAPPERKPWGEVRVFTRDPDGYLIEFYQILDRNEQNASAASGRERAHE